jgi:hypothetical protein
MQIGQLRNAGRMQAVAERTFETSPTPLPSLLNLPAGKGACTETREGQSVIEWSDGLRGRVHEARKRAQDATAWRALGRMISCQQREKCHCCKGRHSVCPQTAISPCRSRICIMNTIKFRGGTDWMAADCRMHSPCCNVVFPPSRSQSQ